MTIPPPPPPSTPAPTTVFRQRQIRIVDLVGEVDLIQAIAFEDCMIVGPALLIPTSSVEIVKCTFLVPDGRSLFWPFDPRREVLSGGIHLVNVQFNRCTFDRIGMGVPEDRLEAMAAGFSGGGDDR